MKREKIKRVDRLNNAKYPESSKKKMYEEEVLPGEKICACLNEKEYFSVHYLLTMSAEMPILTRYPPLSVSAPPYIYMARRRPRYIYIVDTRLAFMRNSKFANSESES